MCRSVVLPLPERPTSCASAWCHASKRTGPSSLAGAPFGADALVAHMAQDKKAEGGALTFILARAIGDAFVAKRVDAADARAFLIGEGASA